MRQHFRGPFSAIALALTCFAATVLAQPSGVTGYEAICIGTVPGSDSATAYAVDDFGRVVGDAAEVGSLAVIWTNGELIELPGPLGAQTWSVSGISPSTGVLVGSARIGDLIYSTAWVISTGIFVLESLPGGSTSCSASTVSDSGYVVGSCSFPNRSSLWPLLDAPIDLGTLGGRGLEYALDINEHGEAVGSSRNTLNEDRPYLWRNGQMLDIGGEPFDAKGWAWGINDFTEVVGGIQFFGPFHWQDGQRTLLPSLGACGASPVDINNSGVIAGESNPDPRCSNGQEHAVIWERQAEQFVLFDLNDWIPRHPGMRLVSAKDINEAGQMAAYGKNVDGDGRGYLVTPYLFEMSDPVPGRAGRMNTITVTGLQPNQRVILTWGTREGAQKIRPSCPGGTLLIRDPQTLPAVRADGNGVATITVSVPLIARGRTIRMQAIAPFECEISHTVTWTFE